MQTCIINAVVTIAPGEGNAFGSVSLSMCLSVRDGV